MVRSLIHNPRRRGLVGALLFASGPYLLWSSSNGLILGGHTGLILFVAGLSLFFGLIGYGSFHGGFSQATGLDDNVQIDWSDHDRDRQDFMAQTGIYTSMREQWDPSYMREKY